MRIDYTRTVGRKPDLVCIGAQKAGTSWLFELLTENPKVWSPPFKELHFFDTKFIDECKKWTGWHIRKAVRAEKQKAELSSGALNSEYIDYLDRIIEPPMFNGNWYKALFAPAPSTSFCIDVCPEYSGIPLCGVQFVKKFLPGSQFVYLVRDPEQRALSQIRMNVERSKNTPETREEWMSFAEAPQIHNRSNYAEHIPNWMSCFGPERLLFLPFGEIALNPDQLLKQVEDFVKIPNYTGYKRAHTKIHSTFQARIPGYVQDYIRVRSKPQRAYLESTFGAEFCKNI